MNGTAVSRGVNPLLTAIPGLSGTYAWPQITVNAGGQIIAISSLTTYTGNLTVTGTLNAGALVVTGTATFAGPISGQGPIAGAAVDMTPDRGSFTLTHTGFTAAVTSTATWYRIGNIIILNTGGVSGTSNATTWAATGLPAGLQSTLTQTIGISDLVDSGASTAGTVGVTANNGTLTFGKGAQNGGAFTNTGAKGFFNTGGTTFSYLKG